MSNVSLDPREYAFVAGNGRVVAIDPIDGREVWRAEVKRSRWLASTMMTHTLIDGVLVVACGPYITGLDCESGAELWSSKLTGLGSTPTVGGSSATAALQMMRRQQAAAAAAVGG